VRGDLERTLHRRVTRAGTPARRVESVWKGAAGWSFAKLKAHSGAGVTLAGALGWLVVDTIGVGELTVILGFAYVAYEVLREGLPLEEAVIDERKIVGGG
jgi:hypothetical protein